MCDERLSDPLKRRFQGLQGHVCLLLVALLAVFAIACKSDEDKVGAFKAQAEAYAEEGMLKEAVIEYRNVLQIDPNDADAHRGLAAAYIQLGSVNDAYWELAEAIRLDPSDDESRSTYAAIALANQRYDAVLEQADALLADDPNDEVGLVLRAQAYERLDRPDEVEPIMIQVIATHPEKTEYRLLLSNFYARQGRMDDARDEAEAAMAAEPTYGAAAQLLRIAAVEDDSDAETERYLKLTIEYATKEHAEEVGEDELKVDNRGTAYRTAAAFYISRERTDEAIELLERASETLTDAQEAWLQLMYVLADVHRSRGDDEKATEVMRRAAESDEGNPQPYITLSTYRTSQENFAGAVEAAEQAMAIDPSALASRLRYSEALIEYGASDSNEAMLADAEVIVDELLVEFPGLPEASFVLAKLKLARGDMEGAIEALSAALEGKPDWAQARMLLGTSLMGKGELARARVEMALALELDPNLIVARRGLARVHAALNEHEYAIDQGRVYLKERPKDAGIRVIVAQSLVRLGRVDEARDILLAVPEEERNDRAKFAIARIELASGNYAEARRLMEVVEKSMPYHVRVLETFVTLDRADGRMAETEARLKAAVEASPDDPNLLELQGSVAALLGDLVLAEASFKRAIEIEPRMLDAYTKLAAIYNAQGRTDDTIAVYEQAVAANPKASSAHHSLGVLYEMNGKRALALEHYDLAIEYDDTNAESKNNLAYLLATGGQDLDRALTLAQEAKAALPGNPNTADTLGWVLLKRGVPSAAVGYFREALSNMPPDHPARAEVEYHLGLAYAGGGETDEAVAAFEAALGRLDKQLDAAQASGERSGEPAWASQARAELKKLAG